MWDYILMLFTTLLGNIKGSNKPGNRITFLVIIVLLLGAVYSISPAQIPVIFYKLSLVTIAAALGYWIAYMALPKYQARTETDPEFPIQIQIGIMLFRAVVMLAVILATALAL